MKKLIRKLVAVATAVAMLMIGLPLVALMSLAVMILGLSSWAYLRLGGRPGIRAAHWEGRERSRQHHRRGQVMEGEYVVTG